jgi:hypothetical protein
MGCQSDFFFVFAGMGIEGIKGYGTNVNVDSHVYHRPTDGK